MNILHCNIYTPSFQSKPVQLIFFCGTKKSPACSVNNLEVKEQFVPFEQIVDSQKSLHKFVCPYNVYAIRLNVFGLLSTVEGLKEAASTRAKIYPLLGLLMLGR